MKPIAWMFQHSETGNVAFVDSPEQAEKFGKENPRWIVIPLCAAPLAQPEQECIYPECETGIGCDGPCGEKPVDTVNTSQECVDETAKRGHEPVAWHEPGAYGNVTTHKDWALANGWEPLYKEKT